MFARLLRWGKRTPGPGKSNRRACKPSLERLEERTLLSSFLFGPSGIDGAGFQNVVAFDPYHPGSVVIGGDVEGFHITQDYGDHWTTSNTGVFNGSQIHVATVAFSQLYPNVVYAGTGVQGAGGGVMISHDAGQTWQLLSNVPQFAGGNATGPGLPTTHPRSTGNLLALDEADGFIYAGTFKDGVMRSADGGSTWTTLGLSGEYVRGMALSPTDPNTLYVATYGDGVWVTNTAMSDGTFQMLPNSPAYPEELGFVGNELFAAAGFQFQGDPTVAGVYKTSDGGQTWNQVYAETGSAAWESIAGYVDPVSGQEVVYAGNTFPDRVPGTDSYQSIIRSTDGGMTWTPITLAANVHTTMGEPGGETWWFSQDSPTSMLGQSTYVAAQIAIDPNNSQQILVAGRSGVWRSTDGGNNWYPVVRGQNATVNHSVAVDPNQPGRVYSAVEDWTLIDSADSLVDVRRDKPGVAASVGYAVTLDPRGNPAPVYLAAGNRDLNSQGELFTNPNPLGGGTWTSTGLGAATGSRRPLAVAVGYDTSNNRVLLAAVEGGGVWRKVGAPAWTQVNTTAFGDLQPTKAASISWVPGPTPTFSSLVYLDDHQTGVWRSNDAGLTWTKIWSLTTTVHNTGYVAADPTDPTRLYVSTPSAVWRLDGADQGTVDSGTIRPVRLNVPLPGPLAFGNGYLYVTSRVSQTNPAGLYRTADNGATWENVADAYYVGAAGFPASLAIGTDGKIYVGLAGNGTIVGQPTGFPVSAVMTLAMAGFPSPITAGVGGSITVTARDANGNVATWYTGTVVFSSSDGQAVLPGTYTFTAADRGVHTFSATLKTAGTQSITVNDTATAALSGSDAGITVNPAAASKFLISAPAGVSSGVAFSLTVTPERLLGLRRLINVVNGQTATRVGPAFKDWEELPVAPFADEEGEDRFPTLSDVVLLVHSRPARLLRSHPVR
jgi:hypothetical protein